MDGSKRLPINILKGMDQYLLGSEREDLSESEDQSENEDQSERENQWAKLIRA